jgi:RNA polymerase sigma factor (sigma-70 family)
VAAAVQRRPLCGIAGCFSVNGFARQAPAFLVDIQGGRVVLGGRALPRIERLEVYTRSSRLVTPCQIFFQKTFHKASGLKKSPPIPRFSTFKPTKNLPTRMARHPNDWYTDGLLGQKPEAIRSIFNEFLPSVAAFVRANSGTDEDAKDTFMYALEVMYVKLKAGDLVLSAQFSTYLYEVCKRQWLKSLRQKKYDAGVTPDDPLVSNRIGGEDEHEFSEKTERQTLFAEKFKQLAKDCQMVLALSWHTDLNMENVAEAMGWTYAYARKRKHLCKENLIEAVKTDRRYAELRA